MKTLFLVVLALNALLAIGEIVWLASGRPAWWSIVHGYFKRMMEEGVENG